MTEQELFEFLKRRGDRLPRHVAIIMDGNGRWAEKHMLPRIMGHRAGTKTVKRIVEASAKIGIKYLTLYAFSTENWKRPRAEVDALMNLLKEYLKKEVETLIKNNIRLMAIGRIDGLYESAKRELFKAQDKTKDCTGMILVLALNYGGRAEILDAINGILRNNNKGIITEDNFKDYFYYPELPDVDLLIRTSGENRLSNFLLWQCAYSEFYFTNRLWPDFRNIDYYMAIKNYMQRERRFGGI